MDNLVPNIMAYRNFYRRFGVRVTAAIVLSMISAIVLSSVAIYQFTFNTQFQDLRVRLKSIAQSEALGIQAEGLQVLPLNAQGERDPAREALKDKIHRTMAANPDIHSIYILKKEDATDIWKFVIDLVKEGSHMAAMPGQAYNAGRFEAMVKGFNEPSADDRVEEDEWGKTLSGYAPIRDALGRPVAVLGVDIDAKDIYAMKEIIVRRAAVILMIGIVLALALGLLISHRVIGPVRQLMAGAAYIGQGHLDYQVSVIGDDEIAQLAKSFNQMARNLKMSQDKLLNYFFDTVKSMVKILEIRDHYTLGHSESVAKYADLIAQEMGVDPKTRALYHRVCLLHDIGKVGVRDSILQKTGPLDDAEWKMIKLHPVFGEEVLKHILTDPLMLAVIRNHHERYDGKGYPDGLKADQIHLLVAITTVADSFDAMTSTRSYRKAMSQDEAVEQLIKNRGTQFHPAVVDAFLKVLKNK